MRYLLLLAAALALPACTARSTIEPIGQGRTAMHASFGGPFVEAFDTQVPVPNLAVGATHGVTDRLDASGSLYLLPLVYGIVGFDVGAAYYILTDSTTSISSIAVQPRLLTLISVKSDVEERLRIYPALSASAAWRHGENRFYTGFDLLVPLSSPDYDPDPPVGIVSPFIGYRWALGTSTHLLTEIKWHGANVRTNATVNYVNPFGYGAITPLVAIEWGW
jgi:hypothetical protein